MRRYCTRRPGRNVLAMREFTHGDVAIQMAAAPIRVGGRFRFHRKTPVAIENRACLAEYDRGHRSLTLTVSTQILGIIRDILADLLEVPGHSVRVVAPDVGGGFGGEASLYPEEICRFGARPAPRPGGALDGRPRPGTSRLRWHKSLPTNSAPGSTASGSCRATIPSLPTAPGPMRAAPRFWPAGPPWRRGCSRKG